MDTFYTTTQMTKFLSRIQIEVQKQISEFKKNERYGGAPPNDDFRFYYMTPLTHDVTDATPHQKRKDVLPGLFYDRL